MHASAIEFRNQQTLRYRTESLKTLQRDTVYIGATITALIPSKDSDRTALEAKVFLALDAFVKGTWALKAPIRSADTSGFERVIWAAHTRVPLSENYNMPERARLASGDGLSISDVKTSYAVPRHLVAAAIQELRIATLREVAAQATEFTRETDTAWRIGDISFGVGYDDREARTSKGGFRSELDDLLEGDGQESSAERVRLLADVVLCGVIAGTQQ